MRQERIQNIRPETTKDETLQNVYHTWRLAWESIEYSPSGDTLLYYESWTEQLWWTGVQGGTSRSASGVRAEMVVWKAA